MSSQRKARSEAKASYIILHEDGFRSLFAIIEGGFIFHLPPAKRLWSIEPTSYWLGQTSNTEVDRATLARYAEYIRPNKYQIRAVLKAITTPGGFSIVHGLAQYGKTTAMVLECLTVAALKHKVLACAGEIEDVIKICQAFSVEMEKVPVHQRPRLYLAKDYDQEASVHQKFDVIRVGFAEAIEKSKIPGHIVSLDEIP